MAPIIDRVRAATRQELLAILASAITEITIIGRTHYDDENSAIHRQLNEAIHHLSGHLRDLCDPGKEFTESRAVVVGAVLALLHPSAIDRILAHAIK